MKRADNIIDLLSLSYKKVISYDLNIKSKKKFQFVMSHNNRDFFI